MARRATRVPQEAVSIGQLGSPPDHGLPQAKAQTRASLQGSKLTIKHVLPVGPQVAIDRLSGRRESVRTSMSQPPLSWSGRVSGHGAALCG
jgi:hypothetical protein